MTETFNEKTWSPLAILCEDIYKELFQLDLLRSLFPLISVYFPFVFFHVYFPSTNFFFPFGNECDKGGRDKRGGGSGWDHVATR